MGSLQHDREAYDQEKPQHPVLVSDFYMGKYPVTQFLWKTIMKGENPARFQGDEHPVEQLSWNDTQHFICLLNEQTQEDRPAGHWYRLPTEVEWEYAARGGKYHPEGYKYAGSDRLKDVGWYDENNGDETKPVGLKYPNQLGIHDMSGNVWEWCADWYDKAYYEQCKKADIFENPAGPDKGVYRVLRGGGWHDYALLCRVAFRSSGVPGHRGDDMGFRLVLSL